jgi:hypothetical protein
MYKSFFDELIDLYDDNPDPRALDDGLQRLIWLEQLILEQIWTMKRDLFRYGFSSEIEAKVRHCLRRLEILIEAEEDREARKSLRSY